MEAFQILLPTILLAIAGFFLRFAGRGDVALLLGHLVAKSVSDQAAAAAEKE
jgi:hypothetical protein